MVLDSPAAESPHGERRKHAWGKRRGRAERPLYYRRVAVAPAACASAVDSSIFRKSGGFKPPRGYLLRCGVPFMYSESKTVGVA